MYRIYNFFEYDKVLMGTKLLTGITTIVLFSF